MILLTCTNCRGRLEMDDAFAGGVCRCMYCGTIQTVPSHLKRPGAVKKVKALYKQNPRPVAANGDANASTNGGNGAHGAGGTELDQLASVVGGSGSGLGGSPLSGSGLSGSGLSGSGLPSPRIRAQTIAPPPMTLSQKLSRHRTVLIAAAGAVCSLILLAILLFAFSGDAPPQPVRPVVKSAAKVSAPITPPTARTEPNFCGVRLDDRVVVYVLDRGSATGGMFADLKEACYRSVESLGGERKFQIIFWNNGTDEHAFPRTETTFANPSNLQAARKALDDVHAHGQSEAIAALGKAFAAKPDAIVLATGKAYELDESFLHTVEQMRASSGRVKVHTFALGPDDSAAALKQLARQTGGEHRAVTAARLREHAQ